MLRSAGSRGLGGFRLCGLWLGALGLQSLALALARAVGGDEIAEPAHRLNDVDAELAPQATDEHLDRVRVAVEVLVVEVVDDLAARDDAAGVVHEIGEQPVLVRGQLDVVAVDRDAARARVELHRAADQLARRMAGRPAQQRADARQHLLHVEGLCDVVVGAGVEALDLVAPAVARGQDQDRHGAAGLAPLVDDGDAVLLRQAEIEHNGVVGLRLAEEGSLLAVEGAIHHVAGVAQRPDDLPVQVDVVLDDEQAHAVS
jgi:hypothetical protein